MINEQERQIYARQILLPEVGLDGQQKLSAAKVLIIGLGGLGAPVSYYLAAAGLGKLGLCDFDTVSLSNLNRQILYTAGDIGQKKAIIAASRLSKLNPTLSTQIYDTALTEDLALKIFGDYDLIIDCLDNFASRFILNDACLKLKKPFIHAGVGQFQGQMLTVIPGQSPCLRCFLPAKIEESHDPLAKAIIGAVAGVMGSMQALEAIKFILGLNVHNHGLFVYNGLNVDTMSVEFKRSPTCICQNIS